MQEVIRNLPDSTQAERAIAVDSRLARIARGVTIGTVLLIFVTGLLVLRSWQAAGTPPPPDRASSVFCSGSRSTAMPSVPPTRRSPMPSRLPMRSRPVGCRTRFPRSWRKPAALFA